MVRDGPLRDLAPQDIEDVLDIFHLVNLLRLKLQTKFLLKSEHQVEMVNRIPRVQIFGGRHRSDFGNRNFEDIGSKGADSVQELCGHSLFVSVHNVQADPLGSRKGVRFQIQRPERTIPVLFDRCETMS